MDYRFTHFGVANLQHSNFINCNLLGCTFGMNILTGHDHAIVSIISLKGIIISCSVDGSIILWEERGSKTFKVNNKRIYCIAITPDLKHIISGGYEKTVRIWSIENGNSEIIHSHDDIISDLFIRITAKVYHTPLLAASLLKETSIREI